MSRLSKEMVTALEKIIAEPEMPICDGDHPELKPCGAKVCWHHEPVAEPAKGERDKYKKALEFAAKDFGFDIDYYIGMAEGDKK